MTTQPVRDPDAHFCEECQHYHVGACAACLTENRLCVCCENCGEGGEQETTCINCGITGCSACKPACCGDLVEHRIVLTELLRLYDWRKELGKEEAKLPIILSNDPASRQRQRDLRKNLREYGEQKKAAWERTRELLTRGK